MATDTLEKRKIGLNDQNYADEYNTHKKYRRINKSVAVLIFFIFLLILFICLKISSIGFNSLNVCWTSPMKPHGHYAFFIFRI